MDNGNSTKESKGNARNKNILPEIWDIFDGLTGMFDEDKEGIRELEDLII